MEKKGEVVKRGKKRNARIEMCPQGPKKAGRGGGGTATGPKSRGGANESKTIKCNRKGGRSQGIAGADAAAR